MRRAFDNKIEPFFLWSLVLVTIFLKYDNNERSKVNFLSSDITILNNFLYLGGEKNKKKT